MACFYQFLLIQAQLIFIFYAKISIFSDQQTFWNSKLTILVLFSDSVSSSAPPSEKKKETRFVHVTNEGSVNDEPFSELWPACHCKKYWTFDFHYRANCTIDEKSASYSRMTHTVGNFLIPKIDWLFKFVLCSPIVVHFKSILGLFLVHFFRWEEQRRKLSLKKELIKSTWNFRKFGGC